MFNRCLEGIEKIYVNEYIAPVRSSLRGHSKKLKKKSLKRDVRKYSFPGKGDGPLECKTPK